MTVRISILLGLAMPVMLLAGCGGMQSSSCVPFTAFTVYPATGTADHMAKAPGNQVQFTSGEGPSGRGNCTVPTHILLAYPAWTVSDAVNVQVSSAHDSTNGVATCVGATTGPVRMTATAAETDVPSSVSVTLSCR